MLSSKTLVALVRLDKIAIKVSRFSKNDSKRECNGLVSLRKCKTKKYVLT